MRHHYIKPTNYTTRYGYIYTCEHPVYNKCTLFTKGDIGLAIIQQKYNPRVKYTWWGEIEPWLNDELYLHPGFNEYFEERADKCKNGLYPTVTIRQIMWALKMKPLQKERWETVFDRRYI